MVNYKKLSAFSMFSLCFAFQSGYAQSEKAVTEISKNQELKISLLAQKQIGIKTIPIEPKDILTLPKPSIVFSRDKIGIYIQRNEWFKFIQVTIINTYPESYTLSIKELMKGDRVVTEGVALLRVSEMEAFATEE